MALEFNADKERIVSGNLQIRNASSFNHIIGSGGNQKSAIFGNLTPDVDALVRVGINTTSPEFELDVNGQIRTTSSIISDTARINNLDIDTIVNPELILKAPVLTTFVDPESGLTLFPTSVTPTFNDDSEKIATTNFVYNIATNDVGGRIYVSQQIGDDSFDGRSATKPVASIKRAAQLASETDDKETLIIAGGEYLEDNPISLPPKCSVVGDNIRLVICRPLNPGKHMFKAASENYVFGITFRDQIDEDGNALATWNFAYVFDDKQRVYYDKRLGGEFGRDLPLGYQYFGPQKFRISFSESQPVVEIPVGTQVTSDSAGTATVTEFTYDEGTSNTGNYIIENISGGFESGDEVTWDNSGTQESVTITGILSLRAEVEVVRKVTDHTTFAINEVTSSDEYPDGLILTLADYHDFEYGQYLDISGLPNSGLYADLNRFNGRQQVSKRIETTDGFSTQVVIYKDSPTDILALTNGVTASFQPSAAAAISSDDYVVLTLLNSPNKFTATTPNSFRYQDAVDLIDRNSEFIAEEALGRVQAEYPATVFDTVKCKRDIQHILTHVSHDLFYGGNAATVEAGERYLDGGVVNFVDNELEETKYAFREARELSIQALRNTLPAGTHTSISPYIDNTIIVDPTQAVSNNAGDAYRLIQKNKNLIAYEAFHLMTVQYPTWTPPNGTANQDCIDDILANIDVVAYNVLYGGNDRTYDAANVYITNTLNGVTYPRTIENGERDESVYAYEQARDLAIDIIRNNIVTISGSHGYTQYRDLSITADSASPTCQTEASAISTLFNTITQAIGTDAAGVGNLTGITRTEPTISTTYGLGCADVTSTVYTLFDIVLDILDGNASPARTTSQSAITDQSGNVITIRDPWDDLPIIEVSPYIFNSSVISFAGGGGCEIDGSKVATPNVARPNLPEQGKSMVAAAFTIISFGGVGYYVINDGYTQLVSCFVIFCQDGVLAESGGYASITNSATNFGTFALRARGFREDPYSFHRGSIKNITFNDDGVPTFEVESLGGRPLEHYIMKIGGVTNDPQFTSEYFIENIVSVSSGPPFTVEMQAQGLVDIRGNNNRYNDAYNLLYNNGDYIGDEAVGIVQNLSTLSLGTFDPFVTDAVPGDIVENAGGDYYICVRPNLIAGYELTDGDYFQFVASAGTSLPFQPNIEKCRRDTKLTVQSWAQDLLNDSNSFTWDAAKLYIDAGVGGVIHIGGYEETTKAVFRVASALGRFAINNLLRKSSYTLTTEESNDQNIAPYIAQYTTETPYRDETITNSNDDGDETGTDYSYADCSDVKLSIINLYSLTEEILNETEVTSGLVRNEGYFRLSIANRDKLIGKDIAFHRPSIVNSSSHTWEYAGSGNDYNALPQNGGQTGSTNTAVFEQVSQQFGRVYSSGTDELGDFKVGYFAKVENRTGNITFGGTVEISEVSFLKIKGNDLTIEGFSSDNTLGGIFSKHTLLPTQRAVYEYVKINYGNYENKPYSTNPTPRALVELGDNGRINIDQLPALRPFNVFTVANQAERLALEGALAGDIAIQQDISLSFILNEDSEFQVLEIAPNPDYTLSNGDVITASPSTSQGTITNIIEGYIDSVFISDPGSSYTAAPSIFIGTSASSKISQRVYSDEQIANNGNLYTIINSVTLPGGSATPPTHTAGAVISDDVEYTYVDAVAWASGISPAVGEIIFNSSGEVYRVTAAGDTTTGSNEPSHTGLRQIITKNDSFAYEYIGTVWSSTDTHGHGVALKYYSHLDTNTSNVNVYTTRATAISSTTQPSHTSGTVSHGDVDYLYVGDQATATATIANNRVSSITITDPGSGYNSDPIIVFTNAAGDTTGAGADAVASARSRVAITIENNIKVNSGDTFTDFAVTSGNNQPYTITVLDAVNTSAQNINNWVQLTSSNIDAAFITSGIINTARLAESDTNYPANSVSFLRGDQLYAQVVQSLRVFDDETPIVLSSNFARTSYIDSVRIIDGGTGYTVGTYSDQKLFGSINGDDAKGNFLVSDGAVRTITITNGGSGYISTNPPSVVFSDSSTGDVIANVRGEAIVSGGAVNAIELLDGGSGFSQAPNVTIFDSTGSGANATATAVLGDGVISKITITDGGIGYDTDFEITPLPSDITLGQGAGTAADLEAKLATRSLNFNVVDVDIRRVDASTESADSFGNLGVARFFKSDNVGIGVAKRLGQFIHHPNGGISIDQGSNSGLDADLLDNNEGSFYLDGANIFPLNSVGPDKLAAGDYEISIFGNSGSSNKLTTILSKEQSNNQPENIPSGMEYTLKRNTVRPGELGDTFEVQPGEEHQTLNDGGLRHVTVSMRRSAASTTDFSDGGVNMLAFTDNNNAYMRGSGSNFVASLNIQEGGNGYVPGTYTNVPLGGGEGTGLTADIVVNSQGVISSVTMVDSGHGYNEDDSAGVAFIVELPESYFGIDNGRVRYTPWEAGQSVTAGERYYVGNTGGNGLIYDVATSGTSGTDAPDHLSGTEVAQGGTAEYTFFGFTNARIQAVLATTTAGSWSSWQELWHKGNDGPSTGLNADLLDDREASFFTSARNLNTGTINNRRLPDNLSAKSVTGSLVLNTFDPAQQTTAFGGPIYDFYLEGYAYTGELDTLDMSVGITDPAPLQDYIQLNLYTNNNVALGRVQVIDIVVDSSEADFYWTENFTNSGQGIPSDRIVQYGYNLYLTTATINNTGSTPPTHPAGESGNLQFIKKVDNPSTTVSAELIQGVLDETVAKLGTANAPATYYDIYDWGLTKNSAYTINKIQLTTDGSGNPLQRFGNDVETSDVHLVFHTSGQSNNYDVEVVVNGGTSTDGTGVFNIKASNAQVTGNNIWHGGNVTFGSGVSGTAPTLTYDTGANSKAVLRSADGDFGGRYIVASGNADAGFIGTATGNLALTGGTLTGNINFNNDELGLVWARNTDGASIKFYNTANDDADSRLEFSTNDDNNEYFRWTHVPSGGALYEAMRLVGNSDKGSELRVNGYINCGTDVRTAAYAPLTVTIPADSNSGSVGDQAPTSGDQGYFATAVLEKKSDVWNRLRFDRSGKAEWGIASNPDSNFVISRLTDEKGTDGTADDDNFTIKLTNGYVGIQTIDPQYNLQVNGTFAATSKSFCIEHPTKKNHNLVYGSLEGPEHGVYVRGKATDVIELPEYWTALVDDESITVQLTPIGNHTAWVEKIEDNKVFIGGGESFYFVQATRKDIDKLEVEVELFTKEKE